MCWTADIHFAPRGAMQLVHRRQQRPRNRTEEATTTTASDCAYVRACVLRGRGGTRTARGLGGMLGLGAQGCYSFIKLIFSTSFCLRGMSLYFGLFSTFPRISNSY